MDGVKISSAVDMANPHITPFGNKAIIYSFIPANHKDPKKVHNFSKVINFGVPLKITDK